MTLGIGITAMDGTTLGTILGMVGMLLTIAMVTIVGTIGDGAGVILLVGDGAILYTIIIILFIMVESMPIVL